MTIRWPLLVRRVHKWLALVLGIQVVLWTVSGMYMVAIHIDTIHGDHLVRAAPRPTRDLSGLVEPASVLARHGASEVTLGERLGEPVWRVKAASGTRLVDARSGVDLPPPTAREIEAMARSYYTGTSKIVSTELVTVAPLEMQSRKPPYWRVEFEGWNQPTFYLSPSTGELISRRHNLWRIFDVAWMLHIMDYSERTNVNNPLLRVATWSALLMALSGAWLLLWSFPRKKAKKGVA